MSLTLKQIRNLQALLRSETLAWSAINSELLQLLIDEQLVTVKTHRSRKAIYAHDATNLQLFLEQHFEEATEESAELVNVDVGDEVNYREIIMHKDDQPLIYAVSYIPLKRLTKEIREDLIRADTPIGRILKNYNVESRREINVIQIEKASDKLKELYNTEEDFLTRDYTIIHNGEILMWIKEFFPITYFTEI